MFEIIRFDKLLAQKVLNFLMYLETACLLFSHRVKARVCMLYTDSFYKYYFPFAYFRKHTTWSPINTMIYVKCKLLFVSSPSICSISRQGSIESNIWQVRLLEMKNTHTHIRTHTPLFSSTSLQIFHTKRKKKETPTSYISGTNTSCSSLCSYFKAQFHPATGGHQSRARSHGGKHCLFASEMFELLVC